jgi:hypothetical protein
MLDIRESSKRKVEPETFCYGMGKDIENLISSCETCAKQQAENLKEPMIPSEIPCRAWSDIGMDLFELGGTHYLLAFNCRLLVKMAGNCKTAVLDPKMRHNPCEKHVL